LLTLAKATRDAEGLRVPYSDTILHSQLHVQAALSDLRGAVSAYCIELNIRPIDITHTMLTLFPKPLDQELKPPDSILEALAKKISEMFGGAAVDTVLVSEQGPHSTPAEEKTGQALVDDILNSIRKMTPPTPDGNRGPN